MDEWCIEFLQYVFVHAVRYCLMTGCFPYIEAVFIKKSIDRLDSEVIRTMMDDIRKDIAKPENLENREEWDKLFRILARGAERRHGT